MFKFLRPYKFTYIPGLIIYASQGFLSALISSLFLSKITEAVLASDVKGIFISLAIFLGMSIGFFLFVALGITGYFSGELKAVRELKRALFRRFVKNGLEESMASHSGEGIAALNTEADTASDIYGNALAPFISQVIAIVFSAAVVFGIDYRLGLASVAIGLIALLIQTRFAKPLGKMGEETLDATSGTTKSMSNIFSGAAAIRAFNAQERALAGFDRENGKLRALSFAKSALTGWQKLFTGVQGWLTLTGVFVLGGYLVAAGSLSFPLLMMVPSLCQAIAEGMSGIGGAWAGMQAPLAAAKRIETLLEGAETEEIKEEEIEIKDASIVVRDLHFTYRNTQSEALSGVSFDVKHNEMVAVVGESGSGKSTLLKLLGGFFERDGLNVTLGGAALNRGSVKSWRKHFAYVDQSCKLFDMTVGENIALGANKPYKEVSAAEIKEAAVAARADGFISALPQGYDTPCGEKGASLSGGQKQRIAIARALIRKAPVIIFDEATSALDAETERQVMETVYSLKGRYTVLITTHNLSNVEGADKVIVMEKGNRKPHHIFVNIPS